MPNIRPVSNLRNHFAEIAKEARLIVEPIFLTRNGVGSLTGMSMESFGQNCCSSMACDKVREAELEAVSTAERLSHDDAMAKARAFLNEAEEKSEHKIVYLPMPERDFMDTPKSARNLSAVPIPDMVGLTKEP